MSNYISLWVLSHGSLLPLTDMGFRGFCSSFLVIYHLDDIDIQHRCWRLLSDIQ